MVEHIKTDLDLLWKECFDSELGFTVEQMEFISSQINEIKRTIVSRVELPVMPNEVLDGGLTEEEQEFMEMIINWQMENPKAYERIKAFADISISRATLFSALADYASQREA